MNSEYLNALIGGVIISISTILMLLFNGRITGISGIMGGTLEKFSTENLWRYVFLLGLILGSFFISLINDSFFHHTFDFSFTEAALAGLLVGIGTQLGSGCTSGHGVCGLARLSKRSIVATFNFMLVAIIVVFLKSKVL